MGELEVSRAHQPDGGAYRRVRWPINTGCPAIGNRNSRLVRGTGRHTRTRGLVPPWSTIGGIDKSNATARTLGGNSTGNGTGCHRPQKVWPIYSIIVPIAFQRVAAASSPLRQGWQTRRTSFVGRSTRAAHFVFIGKQGRFGSRLTRGCRG